MNKIGVVIVTYNRIEKLKKALDSYESQNRKPAYILVVDNGSTDGTANYIEDWMERQEEIQHKGIILKENLGGSGGYYKGLQFAKDLDAEWIWVADDDAYIALDGIEILEKWIERLKKKKVAAICGSVWRKGKIDTWHRRRVIKKWYGILEERVSEEEYKKDIFFITLFSYVGTALSKEALIQAGLPNRDYFIAYDDSEHSYRIRKQGKICCIPSIKIIHDTNLTTGFTWKTYYNIRNKIHAYIQHMGKKQAILQSGYYFIRYIFQKKKIRQLIKDAIWDAWKQDMGFHQKYNLEWKE